MLSHQWLAFLVTISEIPGSYSNGLLPRVVGSKHFRSYNLKWFKIIRWVVQSLVNVYFNAGDDVDVF